MGLAGNLLADRGREIIQILIPNLLALDFAICDSKEGKEQDLGDNEKFHFERWSCERGFFDDKVVLSFLLLLLLSSLHRFFF